VRVIVAPHNFEIGGSQINALELAAEIARRPEYEVILYAPDGELTERARGLGVELHLSRLRARAPSPKRIRELSRLVRSRGAQLVHTYEWAPTVDAAYGVAWGRGIPVVSTILSMDYPYFVPPSLPVVLGTRALYQLALSEGRTAYLMEPPVDTRAFRPDALSTDAVAAVRAECGAAADECLAVVVGRLAATLKLDGLLTLVRAVGFLAADASVRLAIVGDGPVRDRVEAVAAEVNAAAGREVVRLMGQRSDPLPYYLAADVAVGMGSSALRAMAVGKPLLVQGEKGFWAVADEETLPVFAAQGWFGLSDGTGSVERCVTELGRLVRASPQERAALGRFGRELVASRFSLASAADQLDGIYRDALAQPALTRRQRWLRPLGLSKEIVKYHLSIRLPWLRRTVRRLTRR
jgi:glycosyltransferase involved in cell wall biosynthesis